MSHETENTKQMRLTLQVEGADLEGIDLERFSRIMKGLSIVAGEGSRLVSYDNYKIVVEGDPDRLGCGPHDDIDDDDYDDDDDTDDEDM